MQIPSKIDQSKAQLRFIFLAHTGPDICDNKIRAVSCLRCAREQIYVRAIRQSISSATAIRSVFRFIRHTNQGSSIARIKSSIAKKIPATPNRPASAAICSSFIVLTPRSYAPAI